jgi:hypothetical protein
MYEQQISKGPKQDIQNGLRSPIHEGGGHLYMREGVTYT